MFRLPYQGSYDWDAALAFLSARAIAGVERVDGDIYRRCVTAEGERGLIEVTHDPGGKALVASVSGLSASVAARIAQRASFVFDVDADVQTISAHLSRDTPIASLLAARPHVRVFHGWDGFEVAARAVIGQQVTVARARHLNGVLVARCSGHTAVSASELCLAFPDPDAVLRANLSEMGMPSARVDTLGHVARAALDDPALFTRAATVEETVARLRAIRGVGDWTAHYIAMRACGEPDAFPSSDVGLLRGATDATHLRPTPRQLLARAERWRPWRAYAAHVLWAHPPSPTTKRKRSSSDRRSE